jgi:glycosyltransferase involved in cell wall biosynthesis
MGIGTSHGASTVIFISNFARRNTEPRLGLAGQRVSQVYLGRDLSFRPEAKTRAPALLQRLGVRGRYVLSVSQFYVYKNLTQLALGFARACRGLPDDVSLVFAGAEIEPAYVEQVKRVVAREGISHRVHFLGQVPYADLPPLYAAASMFVFPSTCESFPNILIEGMSSGVPTLSSCLGPMPELAADGATYFDPFDPDDIAGSILRIWTNPAEASALAQRGVEVAQRYSWDATARQLLTEFERAVA